MTIRCGNRVALLLALLLLLAMALPFINYAPNRLLSGEGRWLWQVWPWLAGVQAGLGCALMREPLIAPYLESGELVKIFDMPIDDGRDYYLCVRQDVEMSQDGKLLQSWLRQNS